MFRHVVTGTRHHAFELAFHGSKQWSVRAQQRNLLVIHLLCRLVLNLEPSIPFRSQILLYLTKL